MIKNKKVIGVCLTKIHEISSSEYINHLQRCAKKQGYKLLVFNSFVDFYNNDAFDEGAKSIYGMINYDVLDVMIVYAESFCDKSIVESIVAGAKEKQVPVIMINDVVQGCYSIVGEYKEAFKQIMNHIRRDHGVTDTFFVAGRPENDEVSSFRIDCYKEVLEENGLQFDEARVGYGHYWDEPARKTVRQLLTDGKKPPQAIFCANDYMAFAVCRELNEAGYRVPEDVIVTGFDGVPAAEHFRPRLTTCRENIEGLAQLSVEVAGKIFRDEPVESVYRNQYVPSISESCGCKKLEDQSFRNVAAELYQTIDEMEVHETLMFTWIDRMVDTTDVKRLYVILEKRMLDDSYVCLNNDFVEFAMGKTRETRKEKFSEELVVVHARNMGHAFGQTSRVLRTDMIPDIENFADDDSMYILNAIYVGADVCGYYVVKTDDVIRHKHKIKRVLNTINIAFNIMSSHFRQINMRRKIEESANLNAVTELPNLRGSVKWFEQFAEDADNHKKTMSISVYGLPKYTYIYENFGIKDAEDALCLVTNALKNANVENCFIGHIAEDEFVVVNYYEDGNMVGDVINRATKRFYELIERYHTESSKEYYVEVNCGCTVVEPDWEGTLEGFIKFANNEMYMNRLKSGTGAVIKEKSAPKAHYKAFNLLLEKNLFQYHFQPIVYAKTGEIYAYEALMRTDSTIGMNPLEILETAKEYKRLYEIEKATMFNVLERFQNEREKFDGRKVFINTIPGHFLREDDMERLVRQYGSCMSKCVFELTEQSTVSDEDLDLMKLLTGEKLNSQIAIDDYGMGHSNIVNLMRYAPQVIKIDRFLVENIHENKNKQLFVSSTVEFAKMNNVKVLAEGVETAEELRTVIQLGVDFVQGYYTGRPSLEPVPHIDEGVRQEMIAANQAMGTAGA